MALMRHPCKIPKARREELVKQLRSEIADREKDIDPHSELDWYAMIVGWSIGKGLTPDEAHDFSRFVRYETDLG